MTELFWLPFSPDWQKKLATVASAQPAECWSLLQGLANVRLGFAETIRLDRTYQRLYAKEVPLGLATKPVRLAILSSSTSEHLCPGLRIGALRRGFWLSTYTPDYGQYLQELLDTTSGLHTFQPTAILFAFDAAHLFPVTAGNPAEAEKMLQAAKKKIVDLWCKSKALFNCEIYQQTILPQQPPVLGNNEHRFPGSHYQLCRRLNTALRDMADAESVQILALDDLATLHGLPALHDPIYWHKAKQDISPAAMPLYGDLLARLLAAAQGRSAKCLVLDLDNTLWGGIIGDDGIEGIKIGQGSAVGEAHLALQIYALELSKRGVILAVCSKNDEATALAAFDKHPDMLLKRSHFSSFVTNWNDKASNLRAIAEALNIGLDALVFVDDNPFERNLVRKELPQVAVPELPDDPALYVQCLSAAGYFESLYVTEDDLARSQQYQANAQRENLKASVTDMASYLRSLNMEMEARPFDALGLPRIVQLINKTNQFNLTTKRYTEAEIWALMNNPRAFTLQLRLTDQFGDNGMIGVVIGLDDGKGNVVIDTWLMSCRVLGRKIERATLNLVVEEAKNLGATHLIGRYSPTAKNAMVRDHYKKLGFSRQSSAQGAETEWLLATDIFQSYDTCIAIKRPHDGSRDDLTGTDNHLSSGAR